MTVHDRSLSRRAILKGGAGLALGICIAHGGKAFAQTPPAPASVNIAPNTFLVIKPDNTVTVLCKHIEFGQGPFTGMATLVAEELDADWAQMRAEHAPSNPVLYKNLIFGVQGTGGARGIPPPPAQKRHGGAAAPAPLGPPAPARGRAPASRITTPHDIFRR